MEKLTIKIREKDGLKEVYAKPFELVDWLTTYINRDSVTDYWNITEFRSGLQLGSGRIQKEAKDRALKNIEKKGQAWVLKEIETYVAKNGEANKKEQETLL